MSLPINLGPARRAINSIMIASATIMRKSIVSDNAGGQIDTYTSVGSVSCYYTASAALPFEKEFEPVVQSQSFWRFDLPASTDIRPTDRLVVGSRTFEVIYGGLSALDIFVTVHTMELL